MEEIETGRGVADQYPLKKDSGTVTLKVTIGTLMLISGAIALVVSVLINSAVLAFIGLGLTLWGALFYYVIPSKRIPLILLDATVSPSLQDIDTLLEHSGPRAKGVYLPPKYLTNFEPCSVFLPANSEQQPSRLSKADFEMPHSRKTKGIFLAPPGLGLLRLLEKSRGKPFAQTDLRLVQKELSKLVRDIEIAKVLRIRTENDFVTVELTNHIFNRICQETANLKMRELIGCPLSSAIACVLTKVIGKPIMIVREDDSQDGNKSVIQYQILEDW